MIQDHSHRTYPLHIFNVNDSYYSVDILRNRSFELPKILGEILLNDPDSEQGISLDKIPEEWRSWFNKHQLVHENNQIVNPPFEHEISKDALPDLFALFINVTERCNLQCKYCIVDDTYLKHVTDIDKHVLNSSIENFLNETPQKNVEIHFFGGEPLLNPNAIRHSVDVANAIAQRLDKTVTYVISTNGVLLDENWISYFASKKFTVLLSLDGPKTIQDRSRIFSDGAGSFDSILNNAKNS